MSREGNSEKKRSEHRKGQINPPLTFALKGIVPSRPFMEKLGISGKTAAAFGAGVYSGKGMFKDHFVVPILNSKGEIVAYNGIPVEGKPDPVCPPKFCKDSFLFNLQELTSNLDIEDSELILVSDPMQVLVLAEAGFERSIGFMSNVVSAEQLGQLLRLYVSNQKITYFCASDDENTVENLSRLLPLFFIRLVRYERNICSSAGFTIDELDDRLVLTGRRYRGFRRRQFYSRTGLRMFSIASLRFYCRRLSCALGGQGLSRNCRRGG